jgi:anti-anti-sigma factor
MDSVGLGTLAILSNEARRNGRTLRLHSVSPRVAALIHGLRFGDVIQIDERPTLVSDTESALDGV